MTDAPKDLNDALDKADMNFTDWHVKSLFAAEHAAYQRGLEDAAKVAERLAGNVVTPSPTPVYTNGFVTGVSEAAAAIRALAKEG